MQKVKKTILAVSIIPVVLISFCFKYNFNEQDWLLWANKCLSQSYNPSGDLKLKKWDLSITSDAFLRLRKTYQKNKQVYYSFNLNKLNEVDYLGNSIKGVIQLKTIADDIIVQTYNDRKGDVDSMTTVLNIPVKDMGTERLDSLKEALNYFKVQSTTAHLPLQ
ncbi:MAG: hypothetical protein JWQ63_4220 [Mucilaginibacter sp.]|nr:hypothetical protein [Mucilaginibacter sp.]